jgi:lipopolysaccharide/colanic/teichoic acid biosynthesis glycosyltransferase
MAQLLFSLCRRTKMPFSVIAFCEVDTSRKKKGATAVPPLMRPSRRLLSIIATEAIRETDVLVPLGAPGSFVVLCPGADTAGASEIVRRLQMNPDDRPLHVGQSTVTEDGLELEELIDTALWRMERAAEAGLTFGAAQEGPSAEQPARARRSWSREARRIAGHAPIRRRFVANAAKRAFDLIVVTAAIPLWGPLLLVLMAMVKYGDPSAPVLFVQSRTGRRGRSFGMLKLRTMVPNAEQLKEELRHLSVRAWPDFKIVDDPRITPIGRILRRTSLDELPQLINVLKGDMSLVGPRPTSFSPATYEPWQTARLSVRPGVTGLWQVEGRGRVDFDDRLRLDLTYIERRGFFYDLWILLRTIPAVIQQRGSD